MYQITAASRTPDWEVTAPRSPFSVLNWICLAPPPEQNSWVRHWFRPYKKKPCYQIRGVSHVMVLVDISLSSEIYAKHTNTFIFVKPAVSALLKHMLHPLSVVLWGITGRWPGVWDISTLHSKLSPREEIVTCAHAHGLVNAKPLYI